MTAKTEWQPRRLDELGFVGRGKSRHRPRNDERLYGGPYPFVQTGDIMAADPYITNYVQTYSEFGFQQSKMWPPDTLCMTIAGANTARTAILKFEACFPDSVVGFIPDRTKADLYFVKYSLDLMRQRFLAVSRGATQDNLSLDKLLSFPIPVPSVDEQRRIGLILSAFDDLIENNRRRIKILEEVARALYREWFVYFRFPGHEKSKRIASGLSNIPDGWETTKLSKYVSTKYGYTESTNTEPVGPKYLRGMDINKSSYIDWSEVPYCPITPEDFAEYRLKRGDVVVIRMADPGKVGIVEQDVDAVFASYLIRVTPTNSRLSPFFLFYLMESKEYFGYITGASTGTTRKSASAGVIADYDFVLPPQGLVAEFEMRIAEIRSLLTTLLRQTVNLRGTRDRLLSRLLSRHASVESD
jgi:type I restriction enzyme, S subunit